MDRVTVRRQRPARVGLVVAFVATLVVTFGLVSGVAPAPPAGAATVNLQTECSNMFGPLGSFPLRITVTAPTYVPVGEDIVFTDLVVEQGVSTGIVEGTTMELGKIAFAGLAEPVQLGTGTVSAEHFLVFPAVDELIVPGLDAPGTFELIPEEVLYTAFTIENTCSVVGDDPVVSVPTADASTDCANLFGPLGTFPLRVSVEAPEGVLVGEDIVFTDLVVEQGVSTGFVEGTTMELGKIAFAGLAEPVQLGTGTVSAEHFLVFPAVDELVVPGLDAPGTFELIPEEVLYTAFTIENTCSVVGDDPVAVVEVQSSTTTTTTSTSTTTSTTSTTSSSTSTTVPSSTTTSTLGPTTTKAGSTSTTGGVAGSASPRYTG